MKKSIIFLVYILLIGLLIISGYFISLFIFKFFDKNLFICPYQNPTDFDCVYPALQNGALSILIAFIIIFILGYFIFKYFKKYINSSL